MTQLLPEAHADHHSCAHCQEIVFLGNVPGKRFGECHYAAHVQPLKVTLADLKKAVEEGC